MFIVNYVRLCDSIDSSTPGFLVLHCLPEFAQTHVHWVSDAVDNNISVQKGFFTYKFFFSKDK